MQGPAAPCAARTGRAAPRPRRGSARRRAGARAPTGRCRACAAGRARAPRPCSGSPGAVRAPARRRDRRPGTRAPGTPRAGRRSPSTAGRGSGRHRTPRAPPARRIEVLQIAQDRLRVGDAPAHAARSWRARAPNSCASAITAIGGAVSVRPCRSGATVSARRACRRRTHPSSRRRSPRGACARSISCSTSRRPGESAASSTRPSKARRNCIERRERLLGAHVDAQLARRRGRESCARRGDSPCSSVSALKASRVMLAKATQPRIELRAARETAPRAAAPDARCRGGDPRSASPMSCQALISAPGRAASCTITASAGR